VISSDDAVHIIQHDELASASRSWAVTFCWDTTSTIQSYGPFSRTTQANQYQKYFHVGNTQPFILSGVD